MKDRRSVDCRVKILHDDYYVNGLGVFKGQEYPAQTEYTSTNKLKGYSVFPPKRNMTLHFGVEEIEVIKNYK